uniref:Uncharacterized protein n=1 Tax=Rhizophora mucronata TaxID=61149 RepID=A0A2P2QR74_RHIMU
MQWGKGCYSSFLYLGAYVQWETISLMNNCFSKFNVHVSVITKSKYFPKLLVFLLIYAILLHFSLTG